MPIPEPTADAFCDCRDLHRAVALPPRPELCVYTRTCVNAPVRGSWGGWDSKQEVPEVGRVRLGACFLEGRIPPRWP